jgi:hypothetical protein
MVWVCWSCAETLLATMIMCQRAIDRRPIRGEWSVLDCAETQCFVKIFHKITTMVKFHVISEYSTTLPTTGGGEKIAGGPLYDLGRVRSITDKGTGLALWTKDCVKNVQDLEWDHDDVIDLLHKLSSRDYIDSEWCENGKGAWAACDAYCVNQKEWVPTAGKEMVISYFLKFAINKLGTMVLTVSCHT